MATFFFNNGKSELAKGNIDFANDTIKVALVATALTNPDLDFRSQISEVSGTGYTAGGVALANKTVAPSDSLDKAVVDCDDPVFTGLNVGAVAGAVIYKSVGTAATDILIAHFDTPLTSSGTDVTLGINANGLFTL